MMVGKMSSAQSNEKFSPHKKNTDHKLNKINQSELDDARINIFLCSISFGVRLGEKCLLGTETLKRTTKSHKGNKYINILEQFGNVLV